MRNNQLIQSAIGFKCRFLSWNLKANIETSMSPRAGSSSTWYFYQKCSLMIAHQHIGTWISSQGLVHIDKK